MIFCMAFAALVLLCGAISGIANLVLLLRCAFSTRVPATIMGYKGRGANFGICWFVYRVFVAPDVMLMLEREVMSIKGLLPFCSVNDYVGQQTMVAVDLKKRKLLPHEPILIVRLILSLLAAALGLVMLVLFAKMS